MLESKIEHPKSQVTLVKLKGRLVFSNELQQLKPELATLAGERNALLILDLSQIEYTDSSGIGTLLYLDELAREAGSTLRLAGTTRRVQELLHMTHTDRILNLDPDVATSLGHGPS